MVVGVCNDPVQIFCDERSSCFENWLVASLRRVSGVPKKGRTLKMTYTSTKISVEVALELDVGVGEMELAVPI